MIIIKSPSEIELMRKSGHVTARILKDLEKFIKPGITTHEIDAYVEEIILQNDMKPAFKGYHGYPASVCASVNEQVVHGIPNSRKLKEGDIISIDTGCIYKGYYSDAARTYPVGLISDEASNLIKTTEESFFEGLKFCKVGYRIKDISSAIQDRVEKEGFSIVLDFVGHGIGSSMHEEPQVPNYRISSSGPRLAQGMALAIEPMVNLGTPDVSVLEDNWTAVTEDGKLSAHYENTILITDGEPEILTLL